MRTAMSVAREQAARQQAVSSWLSKQAQETALAAAEAEDEAYFESQREALSPEEVIEPAAPEVVLGDKERDEWRAVGQRSGWQAKASRLRGDLEKVESWISEHPKVPTETLAQVVSKKLELERELEESELRGRYEGVADSGLAAVGPENTRAAIDDLQKASRTPWDGESAAAKTRLLETVSAQVSAEQELGRRKGVAMHGAFVAEKVETELTKRFERENLDAIVRARNLDATGEAVWAAQVRKKASLPMEQRDWYGPASAEIRKTWQSRLAGELDEHDQRREDERAAWNRRRA